MPRSRTRTFLRWFGIVLVLGLGATAVALVVLGDSQKQLRIGVLLGIWAAVVAYFLPPGRRDEPRNVSTSYEQVRPVFNEVGIRTEADPRREYQAQLERTLRHEMEKVLNEQVTRLRGEVAMLRNDLVEKVNGQLRLERTETTRVIGSDIEALQQEVRRLAVSREYLTTPVASLTASREPVTVGAMSGELSGSGRPPSGPRAASSLPTASPPAPSRPTTPLSTTSGPAPVLPTTSRPATSPSVRPLPTSPPVTPLRDAPPRISPPTVSLPPVASIPAPPIMGAANPPPRPAATALPAPPSAPRPVMSPVPTATPPRPVASSAPPRPVPSPAAPVTAVPAVPAASPPSASVPPFRATGSVPMSPPLGAPRPPQLRPEPVPAPQPQSPVRPAPSRPTSPPGALASPVGQPVTEWPPARLARTDAPTSSEPYVPPDPFGAMPRLGVFRDGDGDEIVATLRDGYVGRRRARHSEPPHPGASFNGGSGPA